MWFDANAALAELAGDRVEPPDPFGFNDGQDRAKEPCARVAHVAHVARGQTPNPEAETKARAGCVVFLADWRARPRRGFRGLSIETRDGGVN